MECLEFEPGAAKWKAQTKPRRYGGRPHERTIVYKNGHRAPAQVSQGFLPSRWIVAAPIVIETNQMRESNEIASKSIFQFEKKDDSFERRQIVVVGTKTRSTPRNNPIDNIPAFSSDTVIAQWIHLQNPGSILKHNIYAKSICIKIEKLTK